MTPRQHLVADAAAYVRHGKTAYMALEAVSGECRTFGLSTRAAAMRAYYLTTTDVALERLIKAVEREAT